MKVYIISSKDYKVNAMNLMDWADIDKIGENEIYVRAVKAYLKKKDAKAYLERTGYDHLEITTFENK